MSKLCLPIRILDISIDSHDCRGMCGWDEQTSLGLQTVLVVNLDEHAAFLNDLSAKCSVVKPAVAVELGGTERNEQQRRARLALEIPKLNNTAKNNLLFNEIGKLEKAWRHFGGRSYEG